MPRKHTQGLPSRQQILDFIEASGQPAGKREIARAFGLKGQEKIALKALLKDMADEGLIDSSPGRAFHKAGGVPRVTVLRIVEADPGNVIAVPDNWQGEGQPPPRLKVMDKGRKTPFAAGDRILARTEDAGPGLIAHPMKRLAKGEDRILGVVAGHEGRFWLKPVDKRVRRDIRLVEAGAARPGDLVMAERSGAGARAGARVSEVLGYPFEPRALSLIAIAKFDIPDRFSEEALAEAAKAAALELGTREDLRDLPIIAIDPADARDFDDAVWATPDTDPANAGGFRAIVAIADVSFYVRPGSALDRDARKRGNSVYFPDRVVPMLPEELSAGACSLRAGEDKAVLACHLTIGKSGAVKAWRFSRAVIRVAANIPYEQAQAAIDGRMAHDLLEPALKPLWECWRALERARTRRGPLELDIPERRITLDDAGRVTGVRVRERFDAHRVIEDFMIAANVAAAKQLERRKVPCMYRVHEPPAREKLVALRDYLATLDIPLALGQVITPAIFNRVIERLPNKDMAPQVMEQLLRAQTQAYYSPANQGHFGLALGSYAHFTSPIRRYADLLVHRALVWAEELGAGALGKDEAAGFARAGEHISMCERRAMEAERETTDRYVAAFLAERQGEVFDTRITGVTPFGLFATIEGVGGDGLLPISALGGEYFIHDAIHQRLEGEVSGTAYVPGQRLRLRLAEADAATGALRFELPDMPSGPGRVRRGGSRERQARAPAGAHRRFRRSR